MSLKVFLEEGFFSPIDLFFAERVIDKCASPPPDEVGVFLSLIMAISCQGHLILSLDKEDLRAQVLMLNKDVGGEALVEMALLGAMQLPEEIIEDVLSEADFPLKPLCRFGTSIYLQKNWIYESKFLFHLKRLSQSSPDWTLSLPVLSNSINEEQKNAIERGLKHSLSLIAGGPGTGKTYTAAHLVLSCLAALSCEQKEKFRVILAAPTGKAVAHLEKNIRSQIGSLPHLKSGTLHALLNYQNNLERDEETTLCADLIIVDECSMLDAPLFSTLLSSIPSGGRLVLIGDKNQLPPIEQGSFFADLVESAGLMGIVATEFHASLRAESKEILDVAADIQAGDSKSVVNRLYFPSGNQSVHRVELNMTQGSERLFQEALCSYVKERFPKGGQKNPLLEDLLSQNDQFRILCCMRVGPFGVDAINEILLQHYLRASPSEGWLPVPILITRNDYSFRLYNGDTGFLLKRLSEDFTTKKFSSEDYAIFSDKGGGIRRLSAYTIPSFEYAYALSVHKSQGSEYGNILLLAPEGSDIFGREVLYTAMTRARRSIAFDGSAEVLEKAIQTSSRKRSGLKIRLGV